MTCSRKGHVAGAEQAGRKVMGSDGGKSAEGSAEKGADSRFIPRALGSHWRRL